MLDWALENIVLLHYLLFCLGFVLAALSSFKHGFSYYFWDAVGVAGAVFALVCLTMVSSMPPSDNPIDDASKLFLLMSITTVGLAPLATTASFVLSGRLVGRYARGIGSWVFGRMKGRRQEA